MAVASYRCFKCDTQFEKPIESVRGTAEVCCPECGGTGVYRLPAPPAAGIEMDFDCAPRG